MKVKINFGSDVPDDLANILKFVIEFSVPYLFPNYEFTDKHKLSIFLKNKKDLLKEFGIEIFGCAYHMHTENNVVWLKSECGLDLCKQLKLDKMILTLFHELTHIKQIWVDGIEFLDSGVKTNEGLLPYEKHDSIRLSPWEIEANGYETALFNIFIENLNLSKKSFSLPYNEFLRKIKNVDDARRTLFEGIGEGCSS